VPDELLSLARGVPSTDLLPVEGLRRAAQRALNGPAGVLLYGDAAGLDPLRTWFAQRSGACVDDVILTNGSLHGLDLLGSTLNRGRAWSAVEAPTYDFALATIRRGGGRIVALDRDGMDLDLDALEREIHRAGPPRLVYVIPTFQNPSGATLGAQAGRRLIELARVYDFPVVTDDPYRDLSFGAAPPPTLHSFAPEHVILMTSLSKTVAPGMRVGALMVPKRHRNEVYDLASHTYIAPGRFAHGVALEFCSSEEYPAHLATVAQALEDRATALTEALNEELGGFYRMPEGGYFLWIAAPGGDARRAAAQATQHGVAVQGGDSFFLDDRGNRFLRLSFAGLRPDLMPLVAARLRAAWREWL